jgi:hypothetical protein
MAQQMDPQKKMGPNVVNTTKSPENLLDSIKSESKNILLIVVLSVVFNLDQVNDLFKLQPSLFVSEAGALNMQSVLVKAILIGLLYYVVKTKVF